MAKISCPVVPPGYPPNHDRDDGVYHRLTKEISVRERTTPPLYRIKKPTFSVHPDGLSVNLVTCAGCARCSSRLNAKPYKWALRFALPRLRTALRLESLWSRYDPTTAEPPHTLDNPCHHLILHNNIALLGARLAELAEEMDAKYAAMTDAEKATASQRPEVLRVIDLKECTPDPRADGEGPSMSIVAIV